MKVKGEPSKCALYSLIYSETLQRNPLNRSGVSENGRCWNIGVLFSSLLYERNGIGKVRFNEICWQAGAVFRNLLVGH